ncbi:endonuclease domain-containing protein [Sphingomonas sp. HMWF008]|nr:endonuclease domain-containing protein [Sphingomonas sp. HMWF008]
MYPVRRQISPHAARLRRERTDVENAIWQALRNRQCDGFKFRFQATIGAFVVDFLCIEARLIVELDGGQHSAATDAARTRFLEAHGYRVLRFWNSDVVENRDGVLEAIRLALAARVAEKKKTLTQPSPAKAGEG